MITQHTQTNGSTQRARDYASELAVPNEQLTHTIIGVAIEVHRHLGPGLLEAIYERAMQIELDHREIPYRAQVPVPMLYKGEPVGDFYADLIVAGRVIVELKAVSALNNAHLAQVLSYLGATRLHLGLLINFNEATLVKGVKRVVRDAPEPNRHAG
jgi:GxxExxY protein